LKNATLLLLAIALVGCREAQPEHEPATVVTPDVRPAGSLPPEVSGGAEGTAEGMPDPFPYALATNRRIEIQLDSYLEAVAAEAAAAEAYAAWLAAQETATVVVSNARVEGERPIPPADSQAKLSQPGATGDGTNAGSTPAPSATTSLQSAAIAAGWPAELAAWVERVALCESSGSTAAVSSAGYVGLMQVAPWLHGPVPADAVGQLAQAYGVYQAQGAGAWPTCGS
jgi:hypothetical protein